MNSPALAFTAAQEAAFRASAALATAMGVALRLYQAVPNNAPLPYVVNGSDQVIPEDTGGCGVEAELFSTVTFYTRPTPPDKGQQARAIGAALIAAGVALAVPGWTVDEVEVPSEQYDPQADQSTRGVVVFRYLLTEQ